MPTKLIKFEELQSEELINRRKEDIGKLVLEIVDAHESAGFEYPIGNTAAPFNFPYRIVPSLNFNPPKETEFFSIFRKVWYNPVKHEINFNFEAIADLPENVARLQERLEYDPTFRKQMGWIGDRLLEDNPALRPTSLNELKTLISRTLGEFYLNNFLKNHSESWLHPYDNSTEQSDFSKPMIRAGIIKYFEYMFTPQSESMSRSAWIRDNGNEELAKEGGPLRNWYIETGGHDLVKPAMDAFNRRAIHYFSANKFSIMPNYQLIKALDYKQKALTDLTPINRS